MKLLLTSLFLACSLTQAAEPAPNPLIDYPTFRNIARAAEQTRKTHRLTEEQFAQFAKEPSTIVLDARSGDKYALRHIRGAANLPFTDFTAEALAQVIPKKSTRILIYCNNNFVGAPISLAPKSAPASLNISTFIALTTYGYTEVYELAPLLDVATTSLQFEGSEIRSK